MKLKEFLVRVKQNTYASVDEDGENILVDGSKEIFYKEGDFKYRDRYFGSKTFVGEEIIWQNNEALWSMNYYGGLTSNIKSAKEVYEFLKKAMKLVMADKPYRGPDEFKEGNFKYVNNVKGNLHSFKGEEKIFFKEQEIYHLNYHGGQIN